MSDYSPCVYARLAKPTEPTPYDVLMDHLSGPEWFAARAEARELCGACPIREACLSENADEDWAKAVMGDADAFGNCAHCGGQFEVSKHAPGRLYCGPGCGIAARRARQRVAA